ncbi:MAG TPA: hypothetical protein VKN99_13995 [Polyangia bacterium]|nr:hypothetical protein [Polyangia bacterium]
MRWGRWLSWAVAGAALCAAAACVGQGTGEVKGQLHINWCSEDNPDYNPRPEYNMHPDFFVGEPIEDFNQQQPYNRLEIRVQPDSGFNGLSMPIGRGGGIDTFMVSIRDVRQVGLRVGQPIELTPIDINYMSPNPPPVRAGLLMQGTCPFSGANFLPADSDPATGTHSTITFTKFGSASMGATNLPADFRVDFGDELDATFDLDLVDYRYKLGLSPDGMPHASGHVTGNFAFELRRGAAGQTFP